MLKEYNLAEKAYKKCLIMFDGDEKLYYNLGLLKMQYFDEILILKNRKIQYSEAVNYFLICANINPQHPNAIFNIAYIYNLLKSYERTDEICYETYKNEKSNGITNYYKNWAIALTHLKKYEDAEKIIQKYLEIDRTDESIF